MPAALLLRHRLCFFLFLDSPRQTSFGSAIPGGLDDLCPLLRDSRRSKNLNFATIRPWGMQPSPNTGTERHPESTPHRKNIHHLAFCPAPASSELRNCRGNCCLATKKGNSETRLGPPRFQKTDKGELSCNFTHLRAAIIVAVTTSRHLRSTDGGLLFHLPLSDTLRGVRTLPGAGCRVIKPRGT